LHFSLIRNLHSVSEVKRVPAPLLVRRWDDDVALPETVERMRNDWPMRPFGAQRFRLRAAHPAKIPMI